MSTKISAATAVSTLSDSYALPLSTGGSSANKVTVSTLAQYAAKYCAGIGVARVYSSSSPSVICANDLSYYLSNYSSHTPLGLVIASGDRNLVISLTEPDAGTMYWDSSSSNVTDTNIANRRGAWEDWDGETHCETAALTDPDYAMGYCSTFSIDSGYGYGLGEGQWWLPSAGQLLLMMENFTAINLALTLLSDAGHTTTQLQRASYWSSSEYSASLAWHVHFGTGHVGGTAKTDQPRRVRPVSALQELEEIS